MRKFENVPFRERAQSYRLLSARAREAALEARNDDAKQSFMLLAKGWDSLADSFEPRATYLDRIILNRVAQ